MSACGIPASAKALAVTVTVVGPAAAGNLRLYSADELQPLTSTISFQPGQTRGTNAVVSLGAAGDLSVFSAMSAGTVHFVLDVADSKCGERAYFEQLYRAIHGPELSALLDYLLRLDLVDFDFRNPPHTAGLNAQKLTGTDSVGKFWLDCLRAGEIVGADTTGLTIEDPEISVWPKDTVCQVLHAAYVDYASQIGLGNAAPNQIEVKNIGK